MSLEAKSEVKPLDKDQVQQLKAAFDFFAGFDKDRTKIETTDLRRALRSVGLTLSDAECKQIIAKYESKPGEGMTFDDFVKFYANSFKSWNSAKEMKEVFRLLDTDGDGFVEMSTLRTVFSGLLPSIDSSKIKEYISEFADLTSVPKQSFRDFYLNGKINYDEFVSFLFS
jgi:calcium-binding protein CML